jgi:hypothetical protein
MNNNEEAFVTGLTTNQDNIEEIVEKTTSAIESKVNQPQFHNRAERRKFAKKLGKSGRAKMGTISETAKKLTYINLIQKLRELNEEKENENYEQATED